MKTIVYRVRLNDEDCRVALMNRWNEDYRVNLHDDEDCRVGRVRLTE